LSTTGAALGAFVSSTTEGKVEGKNEDSTDEYRVGFVDVTDDGEKVPFDDGIRDGAITPSSTVGGNVSSIVG